MSLNKRLRLLPLISVLLALLPIPCYPVDSEALSDFRRQYLNFSDYFANKNWDLAKEFVSDHTRCGFGTKIGTECLEIYKSDNACWHAAVIHLTLGCRYLGDDPEGNLICGTPEIDEEENLFRANMTFAFSYNLDTQKMHATWLMCGGD